MKVTHNAPPNTSSLESTKQADKTPASKGEVGANVSAKQASGSTSVEISDNARLMKRATELAKASPDIRADKVASLKKAIAEGSYKVDSEKLADKIIEDHLAVDFGKNEF